MIKLEKQNVVGWEAAIRGMRNPMNSWDKSDSCFCPYEPECEGNCAVHCGEHDHDLMMKLASNGPVHAKYRRMINVYVDITAPLYWWKEFDTYKVGTVANSCSTMHKIADKEFEFGDFSCEHLTDESFSVLETVIKELNVYREAFIKGVEVVDNDTGEHISIDPGDKDMWWQMIQLLPSSYNQKRTVMLNYEVLANIYKWRKDHKLDEWREFCKWIESLPYSEIITWKSK